MWSPGVCAQITGDQQIRVYSWWPMEWARKKGLAALEAWSKSPLVTVTNWSSQRDSSTPWAAARHFCSEPRNLRGCHLSSGDRSPVITWPSHPFKHNLKSHSHHHFSQNCSRSLASWTPRAQKPSWKWRAQNTSSETCCCWVSPTQPRSTQGR